MHISLFSYASCPSIFDSEEKVRNHLLSSMAPIHEQSIEFRAHHKLILIVCEDKFNIVPRRLVFIIFQKKNIYMNNIYYLKIHSFYLFCVLF